MSMRMTRLAAAAVALVAWAGLAVQLQASAALTGSILAALSVMAAYFTVLTNLVVALVFTAIALGSRPMAAPRLVAGVALNMLLVGIVFAVLLEGLRELSGGAVLADALLHRVTPVLVPLFWLAFVPKGALRRVDPLLWAIYPAGYIVYALLRGAATGMWAYPFMNLDRLGAGRVALNLAVMGAAFLAAGFTLVLLDARLGSAKSGGVQPPS